MFGLFNTEKTRMVGPDEALPGRDEPLEVTNRHAVHGRPIKPPFPEHCQDLIVGMGCFWGAEQQFWDMDGVYTTAVGYAGGYTPNPTYEEVCTARTGHTEAVRVIYDPEQCSLEELLRVFWESHDPTQQMRQGNDVGTQYRSAIYVPDEAALALAEASREAYEAELSKVGLGPVATELRQGVVFYYAEDWHQQYLHKNPGGYCGLKGTGVACPRA
ncbi:peptide-methionine (S)-S-oxide reductase [Halospina denitrificans]|uniref:Peptide methionine sulfoxide reductase MsrA n=1 Tax=Halospina denitrificans TaxID=332522 RepID=A0A4R7JQ71_9GAMM|nr:peptide-methionine (S)-S-oxide reductase MsrA [Halospina denitrificans]TDT39313.1 peptide-methionine (S)-S-oxide reductase [Halospina denitrificans]